MTKILRLWLILSSVCILQPAVADVYKCTDEAGEVVFQGEPCRQGEEVKLDIRFAEQTEQAVDNLITGSWCEIGTSSVLGGTVEQDNALRKTWIFSERQMVQHVSQDQRMDTFKYPIRQEPGSFVVDHPAYGSGQVSWQVKKLTDDQLVIAAYGGFTHLSVGNCEMAMASAKN
ncbi:DUF4124 domain-containing protein [Rheinheimera baltica]|uniref:DUF4124 domain-containing protein n=1 Tax=Rheinheimera baltica TaxID=67576 RepID=A0ABT9HXE6_9GAMM|nr:DUF4124 domain-containing protein [Rheinheimera baltica]MDP5135800.1 DUF4124 domain-containing protein [Rheinheimera baltica]MDP5142324.1 DUF4124 domain-containing protein [Rheinheimera baltica]MDP5150778.1 DUF4124 domain-containing protein [Rheinheimera baltica]MDP5189114.1 DUF4124 domain-containing protein [Rheinheimera baltica]